MISARSSKTAVAAVLGSALVWWVYDTYIRTASDYAVVTAQVMIVRSPIRGNVSHQLRVGQHVDRNTLLAKVRNHWIDDTKLNELRAQLQVVEAQAAALREQIGALQVFETRIAAKGVSYRGYKKRQLDALLSQANSEIGAAQMTWQDAASKSARIERLTADGLVSDEALESAKAHDEVAKQALEASISHHSSLQVALQAVSAGLNLDASLVADPAYAEQRGDDIRLRRLERASSLATLKLTQDALQHQLASEQAFIARNREAELHAAGGARVWRVATPDGTFVDAGQQVLELVPCEALQVQAFVTAREYAKLKLGGCARFVPARSGMSLQGRVAQLLGPWRFRAELGSAEREPPPTKEYPQYYSVLAEFSGLSQVSECNVGITGRVYFE